MLVTVEKGNVTAVGFAFVQGTVSLSKMTKLAEWLFFGVLFISFWLSLVTRKINHYILDEYSTLVLCLPVILIGLFGVYASVTVLWRVYTFNDCESAAVELKKQIKEAKADLKARGFQFKEEKTQLLS